MLRVMQAHKHILGCGYDALHTWDAHRSVQDDGTILPAGETSAEDAAVLEALRSVQAALQPFAPAHSCGRVDTDHLEVQDCWGPPCEAALHAKQRRR